MPQLLYFFAAHFGAATIRGRRLFFRKHADINDWLDNVHTSEMVATIRPVSSKCSLLVLLSSMAKSRCITSQA